MRRCCYLARAFSVAARREGATLSRNRGKVYHSLQWMSRALAIYWTETVFYLPG